MFCENSIIQVKHSSKDQLLIFVNIKHQRYVDYITKEKIRNMAVTRKQWLVLIAVILLVTIGVVIAIVFLVRHEKKDQTVQERVHTILTENPLIDG
jgi:hypothetical protein